MARGGARGQGPQLPKAMQSMLAESGASSSLKPHGGRYGSGSTLQKKRKKSAGQQQKPSVSSPRPSQSSSKNGKPQGKRKAPEPELETEKEPTTEPQRKAKKPKTALEKLAERQLNKSPDGMDKGRVKSVRKAATAAEAQEDLEIAWLESQLTRGPKAETDAVDDGLDDLLGDLDDVEAALGWRGGGKSIPSETIDAESESESEEDELDHLLEEDEEWDGISQHSKDSTEPALESESQHVPTSPETSTKQAYVPPHLRNKAIPQDTPAPGPAQDLPPDARLDRQISSHLNKLSPQNLSNIQAALWALYSDGANGHFPRALVASSIVRLLLVRIDTRDSIGENQLLCFAALISGLKTIREGCVLESLKHFDAKTSVPQDEDDKSANNIVRFWARCYNLGAISCQFLYGLIRELVRRLGESDVEQLLALLKSKRSQHC